MFNKREGVSQSSWDTQIDYTERSYYESECPCRSNYRTLFDFLAFGGISGFLSQLRLSSAATRWMTYGHYGRETTPQRSSMIVKVVVGRFFEGSLHFWTPGAGRWQFLRV
jgi:hypothetical protein